MSSYWDTRIGTVPTDDLAVVSSVGDLAVVTTPTGGTTPAADMPPAMTPHTASRRAAKKKSIWQLELTPTKVPRRDLMQFSRQLAVFVKAGIPILEALGDITEETTNKHFRAILTDIQADLRAGETMAGAVARHAEAFPPFYANMLETAELTGHLDDVLIRLADYLERDIEARRKLVSALIYPVIVLVLAIVVILVMVIFVLPKFKSFFVDLHAKLPLPTRMLLAGSDWVSTYWYIPIAVGALFISLVLVGQFTTSGRAARDAFLLKVPVLGDVIRHAVLERFCRVLGSMVSAGVALPQAMLITADATSNAVYRRGLIAARAAMMRGEGLAAPLAATGLFPAAARQILRVGEESGSLDDQLELAANFFDRELDYKIAKFTGLFEPAVIIFVGVMVGFVAIALISAMYGIYHQVQA
jgi:type IV pilus assembly protein PilC